MNLIMFNLFPMAANVTPKSDPKTKATDAAPKCNFCRCLIDVISKIALGIFYIASAWLSPFCFSVGFVVGAIYSEEVKKRITHVFNTISWTWLLPTAAVFYAFAWPYAITIQGFLAGLDLGARWCQAQVAKTHT
jgi:hypothetical protein